MNNKPSSMSGVGHRERTSMDAPSKLNPTPKTATQLKHYTDKISCPWLERSLGRWNIAQKFAYTYALALGIAIVGTGIGLSVGDYYERQALEALYLADTQEHRLENLKAAVSEMRLHPQQLMPTFGKAIFFDLERARFSLHVNRANENLDTLTHFLEENPHRLAVNSERFRAILQKYDTTIEQYRQAIAALWPQLNFANLTPAEIPSGRLQLLTFLGSPAYLKLDIHFNHLAEDLTQALIAAGNQKIQATQNLNDVRRLRLFIIVGSMALSAAIAVFLALLTGRAIARPLIAVKNVAREVTRESNFNLRAPITTNDEIGALATSLNQLIQGMDEYTRELQQTQAQLIHSEKMSSLGQMVGGIAHEINNPVNFIHGNIEYLDDYLQNLLTLIQHYQTEYPQPPDPIRSQIDEIELEFLIEDFPKILASMKQGTYRIQSIVTSLRNFSRLDEADMKAVDLHEGLNSTLIILNNRIGDRIEVVQNYGNLPLVECYPAQLNQVFLHLLANALDAIEEVPLHSQKQPQIVIHTEKLDSERVSITIGDNGFGIPPEIQDKLFDPFFTTKPVGQGTGLGLSIAYKIIEKHHGTITVNSTRERGTKFTIALPLHRDRAIKEKSRNKQLLTLFV